MLVAIVASACGRVGFDEHGVAFDASTDATPDASATYAATVLADQPIAYCRFDELTGIVANDSSASRFNGTYGTGVALGASGLIADDPSTAIAIPGAPPAAASNVIVAQRAGLEPTELSIEAWVRSDSVAAQPILTYGESYQLYI